MAIVRSLLGLLGVVGSLFLFHLAKSTPEQVRCGFLEPHFHSNPSTLISRDFNYQATYGLDETETLLRPLYNSSVVYDLNQSCDTGKEVVINYFEFRTFDGLTIPIAILVPKNPKSLGVVLVHGHMKSGQSGISMFVDGAADSYLNAGAWRIAQAGFIVAVPELRGFGLLGPPDFVEHKTLSYNAILSDSTYQGLTLRDLALARQVLAEVVDMPLEQIGIGGVSLGGELAVKLAASDKSVPFVISHAYGGRLEGPEHLIEDNSQPHYCHLLPNDNLRITQAKLIANIAPRPLLFLRGEDNHPLRDDFLTIGEGFWDGSPVTRIGNVSGGRHEFFVSETISFLDSLNVGTNEG